MLSWFMQGLGKVVPKPEEKPGTSKPAEETAKEEKKENKEEKEEKPKPAEATVVQEATPKIKPEEAAPSMQNIAATQPSQSSAGITASNIVTITELTITPHTPISTSSVLGWLKQGLDKVVPQPSDATGPLNTETSIPVQQSSEGKTEDAATKPKTEEKKEPEVSKSTSQPAVESAKPSDQPAEIPKTSSREEEKGVFGWFVQGLGKVVPQPASKLNQDGTKVQGDVTSCPVEEICIRPEKEKEMVVEDVEPDYQEEGKQEVRQEEAETQTDESWPLDTTETEIEDPQSRKR
ncbi:cyclic nucleotide-gated cation channel beta-1-like [Latimeria chalumnae]|uniref:cyclic nucleotide-gated cation channel beta-1-like n=1 Tax=Latimeria chalumnae TaxID=7897 RepID=UPI00313D7BE7